MFSGRINNLLTIFRKMMILKSVFYNVGFFNFSPNSLAIDTLVLQMKQTHWSFTSVKNIHFPILRDNYKSLVFVDLTFK